MLYCLFTTCLESSSFPGLSVNTYFGISGWNDRGFYLPCCRLSVTESGRTPIETYMNARSAAKNNAIEKQRRTEFFMESLMADSERERPAVFARDAALCSLQERCFSFNSRDCRCLKARRRRFAVNTSMRFFSADWLPLVETI